MVIGPRANLELRNVSDSVSALQQTLRRWPWQPQRHSAARPWRQARSRLTQLPSLRTAALQCSLPWHVSLCLLYLMQPDPICLMTCIQEACPGTICTTWRRFQLTRARGGCTGSEQLQHRCACICIGHEKRLSSSPGAAALRMCLHRS